MAQQILNNNATFGEQRSKINANFAELYCVLPRRYSARSAGVLPQNSGAANTAALQALIDSLHADGFFAIWFEEGTYLFDAQGSESVRPGSSQSSKGCIWLKSNVFLVGQGEGTVLKRGNNQQTEGIRVHLIRCNPGTNAFGLSNLRLNGNIENQPGYSGAYTQGDVGGALLALGDSSASNPGMRNCCLENIWLENNFGAAADILFPNRWYTNRVRVKDCGEGYQFVGGDSVIIENFQYDNPNAVSVGDGIETASTSNVTIRGFEINGITGGSALDLSGTGIYVYGGHVNGGSYGPVVQCEGANNSLPNSNHWLVSDVHVRDVIGVGFSIAMGESGTSRGVMQNCHVTTSNIGFNISPQSTRGIGLAVLNGCSSKDSAYSGLIIGAVNKVRVNNCQFDDGQSNAYGILVRSNAGAGDCVLEVEHTTANNNGRFGVYVEEGHANPPQGFIRVSAQGNQISNESYWGTEFIDSEIFIPSNNIQNLEVTNTRTLYSTTLSRSDLPITGERTILWNHPIMRQLNRLTHNAIVDVIFGVATSVEHVGTTAGNNISLKSAQDESFAVNDCLRLRWDATTQLAYEVSRDQSTVAAWSPMDIPAFRSWYKHDEGLWQNAAKTISASTPNDPVRVWAPLGTGPDFSAPDDSSRPLRDVGGGIVGDGATRFLESPASINLFGPYTIFIRARTLAPFANNRFIAAWNNTAGWDLYGSASSTGTVSFYENEDSAGITMGSDNAAEVMFAIAVAANGNTTLWTTDNNVISGNGSSGGTVRYVNATMWMLANNFASAKGQGPLRDVIFFDRELSNGEITQLRNFFV